MQGTISLIQAALGNKPTAIGYMQIWKTVRQMQLRDPFPTINRIAGKIGLYILNTKTVI